MSVQNTANHEVKAQITALLEQLSPDQLRAVYQLLQQWFFTNGSRNGLSSIPAQTTDAPAAEAEPWRQYTTHLKASPHWDEFLEAVAAARQETNDDENAA